ncbi:hypothetical protein Vretimale_14138 [Volvox reticuliferus]|uniref:HECT-type E3 ubiquitin transferase n=1 Tax=Volvox reticuliferus TaxID=1737510 RepID=A0A8J4CTG3_9CHLO|nr:hypothetical protein Vretifemale_16197 [Volvox reticuliferus]GIM10406.1 hypothetical protein Vretimale_14138 [Volvox reticuliferus]
MFFPPSRNDIRGKAHGGRGGRSKVELSAQEELAKAREERERRKRQKLEQKAAIAIQAAWRGWSSRLATKNAAKTSWIAQYGYEGEKLQERDCLSIKTNGALGRLLFFYRPGTDWRLLVSVARIVAAASKTDHFKTYIASYNGADTSASMLYQLKALALQCFLTLSHHRYDFAPQLAMSRPSNPLDPLAGVPAGALLECVLLLVSPDPFTPVLGKPRATGLAATVLGHLAANGMCGHLFLLLMTVLLPPPPPQLQLGHGDASLAPVPHIVSAKPYVETLTTQLTVRLLALKSFNPARAEDSLHVLLLFPDLWRRCTSLQPVSARLCRVALTWLSAAGPQRLESALQPLHCSALPWGTGTAVAILLANILAVGPRLLEGDKAAAAAGTQRALALNVVRVLHAMVSLLPLQPFFPDAAVGGDESEEEVDEAACGSLGVARLTLPAGALPRLPDGLVEAVQGLTGTTGRQLIKQLVTVLLPHAGPTPCEAEAPGTVPWTPGAPPLPGGHTGISTMSNSILPSSGALLEAAEAAHALCEFLWQLGQLPGQQQRVMLAAAVSCDLVKRMWWSFLRHARHADLCGATWLATSPPVGSTPGSTRATCSASSSYNCAGPVSMELELPPLMASAGGGAGATGMGGMRQAGGLMAGFARSRSGGGATLLDGGGSGIIDIGGGPCGVGSGGGGTASLWRPRLEEDVGWLLPLAVTCSAFSAQVATSTLEEFYGEAQRPLPLQQLYDAAAPEAGFLAMLRDALWQVLWSDGETDRTPAGDALYTVLARTGGLLYGILYERNCRRPFCPTDAFHATALAPDWFFTEANSTRSHAGREDGSTRVWQVLRHAPYLVPFSDRARLFQQMVGKERQEYREQEESRVLEMNALEGILGNRFVHIRRDRLLFDGFDNLNSLGDRLRGRVRITFIDAHGVPEAGVDGGGLFKDFMEELMRAGLSAEYGLFACNSAHQAYPNPAAMRVVDDAPRLMAFLGRMLGKAMYENILLELPLAGFFLKKFRGARCDLNDLPTLDPELYRSLLQLRAYFVGASRCPSAGPDTPEGSQHGGVAAADAMDLGLTFVVADDAAAALGDPHVEVELKPGGRGIPVTAENVNEYIHRVAHYKLNISPQPAVSAFLSGFYEIIPRSWVSMFSGEELQTLVSGAEQRLDLEDMQECVVYAGGYHEAHPVVMLFWEALASFSPEEQGKFLKFVTSCSRAPLLGFKYLEPKLCIQMSGAMLDPTATQRLPTASTCINLLKLPPYRTLMAMREKLLYAITSGAGFDLS